MACWVRVENRLLNSVTIEIIHFDNYTRMVRSMIIMFTMLHADYMLIDKHCYSMHSLWGQTKFAAQHQHHLQWFKCRKIETMWSVSFWWLFRFGFRNWNNSKPQKSHNSLRISAITPPCVHAHSKIEMNTLWTFDVTLRKCERFACEGSSAEKRVAALKCRLWHENSLISQQ